MALVRLEAVVPRETAVTGPELVVRSLDRGVERIGALPGTGDGPGRLSLEFHVEQATVVDPGASFTLELDEGGAVPLAHPAEIRAR